MKKRYFQASGVDITKVKSMYEFLIGHYTYYTMNSWNKEESIANDVKLYNLELEGDYGVALSYLFDEYDVGNLQWEIKDMIREWEKDHPNYQVGFNGRSGGYLVLYNKDNCRNVLPDWLTGFETYEKWKDYAKGYLVYNLKDIKPELQRYTQLVRDFDKLCDELRALVNEYSKMNYDADREAFEKEE